MGQTHLTAVTRHVAIDTDQFAYRRWGNTANPQPPLLLLQHFRGGMDHWDPLMTDGLAQDREVILMNGRGVSSSTGRPRNRIEDMADDVAAFVGALGLHQVDVLGFSLGGFQALDLTWRHPHLVRKLLLLGTGPRGGDPDMEHRVLSAAVNPVPTLDDFLYLFFGRSQNAIDVKVRNGEFKLILPYKTPVTLGHDVAGVVVNHVLIAFGHVDHLCHSGTAAHLYVRQRTKTRTKY